MSGLMFLSMLFYMYIDKGYAGFGQWTAGALFITLGYLSIVLRGPLPDFVPMVIGNTLFACAAVVILQGMRKFLRLSGISHLWFVFPVVNLAGCGFFYFVSNDMAGRAIFTALTFTVPHLYTAFLISRRMSKERYLFYPVIAAEMTAISLLVLLRAGWLATHPGAAIFIESTYDDLFLIMFIALQLMITFSSVMLNNERFQNQLMTAREDIISDVAER
jgi:hypothetical protein